MSSPNLFNNFEFSPPSANLQIDFLRNIQWLLESSCYNSTYKFALIIGLANLSNESGIGDRRSLTVSYEQLAEQLLNLYWRQTLPYSADNENSILSQTVNNGQIKVINSILKLQSKSSTNLLKSQKVNPKAWNTAINKIVRVLEINPVKRLQLADQKIKRDFLYDFDETSLRLKPDIAYCLSRSNQIILKLCQQY